MPTVAEILEKRTKPRPVAEILAAALAEARPTRSKAKGWQGFKEEWGGLKPLGEALAAPFTFGGALGAEYAPIEGGLLPSAPPPAALTPREESARRLLGYYPGLKIPEGFQEGLGKETNKQIWANILAFGGPAAVSKAARTIGKARVLRPTVTAGPIGAKPSVLPQATSSFLPLPPPRAAPPSVPVSATDILQRLQKETGVPFRYRRFRQKALGIYKEVPEVIRQREAYNLDTAAHELGHHLDKRLRVSSLPESMELEAIPFPKGRPGDPAKERFADFAQLYAADRDAAQAQFPQFTAAFERQLGNDPQLNRAVFNFRQSYGSFRAQNAGDEALSQFAFDVPKQPSFLSPSERVTRKLTDRFIALEAAERRVRGTLEVTGPAMTQRRLLGSIPGAAEASLLHGQAFPGVKTVFPALKEILQDVPPQAMKQFNAFLAGRRYNRAVELGMFEAEDLAIVGHLANYRRFASPEFERTAAALERHHFNHVRYDAVDSGILSREVAGQMENKWGGAYVPLRRESMETGMGLAGSQANLRQGGAARIFKRFTGKGQQRIIPPVESFIRDAILIPQASDRNRLVNSLAGLGREHGAGMFVERVPPEMWPTQFKLGEITKQLETLGIEIPEGVDPLSALQIYRPDMFPKAPNIITGFQNGKPYLLQVHPDIYAAYNELDPKTMGIAAKVFQTITALKRTTITEMPGFAAFNLLRDFPVAQVYADRLGINPVWFLRAIQQMKNGGGAYPKYLRYGGGLASRIQIDRNMLQSVMQRLGEGRLEHVVKHPLATLQEISSASDTLPRFAYWLSRTNGGNAAEKVLLRAANESRDLTVDFARMGEWGQAASGYAPFVSAALGGASKATRRFREAPFLTAFKGVAYLTGPTLAYYAWARRQKWYQEMPQSEKDIAWHAPGPKGNFIRIPKPQELGVPFASLPENMLAYLDSRDPQIVTKFLQDSLDIVSPYEIGSFPMSAIAAVSPAAEAYANKSWMGRKIVPESEQRLPKELRFGERTSFLGRQAGKAGMEPRKFDYIIRGYLGRLGQFGLNIGDVLARTAGSKEVPLSPRISPTNIPEVGRFFYDPLLRQPDIIDELYDEDKRISEKIAAYRRTKDKRWQVTRAEYARYKRIQAALSPTEGLPMLSRFWREVRDSPDLPPEETRRRLAIIREVQLALVREALRNPEK